MKLSLFEGTVIFIILVTVTATIIAVLDDSCCENPPKQVVPIAPPIEKDPIVEEVPMYDFPELGESYTLPVPDEAEPGLTWKQVEDSVRYLKLTKKLGKGDKNVSAVGNTLNLIVSNTSLSATTFYNRWRQSIKRAGLPLKGKNLWVTVVEDDSYVEKTHHCTNFGKH